jgi:acetyl-CoA C-acetyltransferase
MGNTAELVATTYKVAREAQDEFAVDSHRKAVAAAQRGDFHAEIVPVSIAQPKGDPQVIAADEGPRADASVEKLGKLKPVFDKAGSVTAGNASTINDGAALLVVMSETRAKELGLPVLAAIEAYATGGMEPKWVMMAPVKAVGNLLAKTKTRIDDYDLIELNEAFSAQGVALINELKLDPKRLNVNGGAVALGHPIGASGARVLVTLIHAMKKRGAKRGMASLCLGGGNAVALSVVMQP